MAMNRRLIVTAFLLVGVFYAATYLDELFPVQSGVVRENRAPEFEVDALYSGSGVISSRKLAGKPYLINFWASWCQVCSAERESIKTFADANPGVSIISVATYDQRSDAMDKLLLRESFQLGFDSEAETLSKFAKKAGLPQTILVGTDGKILMHIAGGVTGERLQALMTTAEKLTTDRNAVQKSSH